VIDAPTSLMDFWPTLHNVIKSKEPGAKIPASAKVGSTFLFFNLYKSITGRFLTLLFDRPWGVA
jgi:hypothetical protein